MMAKAIDHAALLRSRLGYWQGRGLNPVHQTGCASLVRYRCKGGWYVVNKSKPGDARLDVLIDVILTTLLRRSSDIDSSDTLRCSSLSMLPRGAPHYLNPTRE